MKTSAVVRLRVFGTIFGLLSLIGAYDYLMIFTHNTAYFEYLGYGERQIEYFTNYPIPLIVLLTLGVWGAVLGSVLLLVRSRWAVVSLGLAFLSQLVLDIYTFAVRSRWDILGPKLSTQDLLILVLTLATLLYAINLHRKGIIR